MSLNVDLLIEELKQAQTFRKTSEWVQTEEKKKLAKEEVPYVHQLAEKLKPFFITKEIHGETAVLIYKFNPNGKTFISSEVYLKNNGDIVYQVHDEKSYLHYVPDAQIIDGYNIISLEEFLFAVPLYEIYDYFVRVKENYNHHAQDLVEQNQKRRNLFELLKPSFE